MNLQPFLSAGPVIQIHIITALLALVLGGILLWRRKGTPVHKMHGKIWVGLMAVVAISSFFINEVRSFGPFSAVHILTIVTLVSLVQIVRTARDGNIKRHQSIIKGLFYGGLVGAGLLTLIPGRIMHRIFFGKPEFYLTSLENVWIIPLVVTLLFGAVILWRTNRA